MKRPWLWALLLGGVSALVFLAWGPLLVTSPEEALSRVQDESISELDTRACGDAIRAYEVAVGAQGEWKVRRNELYESFWEGDESGFLWVVTYDAPGSDDTPEIEFYVKRFTGNVSQREPDWSFLQDYQL
jgi:hypothetical protein